MINMYDRTMIEKSGQLYSKKLMDHDDLAKMSPLARKKEKEVQFQRGSSWYTRRRKRVNSTAISIAVLRENISCVRPNGKFCNAYDKRVRHSDRIEWIDVNGIDQIHPRRYSGQNEVHFEIIIDSVLRKRSSRARPGLNRKFGATHARHGGVQRFAECWRENCKASSIKRFGTPREIPRKFSIVCISY